MDMRLRIIIIVFAIVAVFYIIQMFTSYIKKKEHFTSSYYDDVERYEDAPAKNNIKPYELRIFLLDEIDKLEISDKSIKGNVMETLFSETSMKDLEGMTKEKRIEQVKSVHKNASGDTKTSQETEPKKAPAPKAKFEEEPKSEEPKSLDDKLKSYFQNATGNLPKIKDYYENNIGNKFTAIGGKLDVAINSLSDMRDILKDVKKEQYIPDLPIPPALEITKEDIKKLHGPIIEGFENIREFADY